MNKVSLVVPTHNRSEKLSRLLRSVYASTLLPAEIIVVDDCSTDNTSALLAKDFPEVRVITTTSNVFSAKARQLALDQITNEYVFFVDDDNVLAIDCIERLHAVLESDSSLGLIAPLMLDFVDKSLIWCAGGVLSKFWMPSHRFQGQHLAQLELPDRITDVVYFPNAWMLRRSLVDLGFKYDTDLFPHNWAEQDTGQQVLRLGYKLATICKAVTWHDLGYQRKLTRVSQQTIYDQARSRILFRRKYRASLPVWVVFWTAIFPLSTFYYLRSALQQKSPFTLAVLYLKGTWTGTFQSINK